ncbi:hypothetical protein B0A52_05170 [Exophiala mesophila]|uniref:RNA helicase n=1 Tax=Exophiala mesophila TaxID=212818 RepID=A0A438N4G5_EXOME|nr:hypothetical protein B0A52_05170 [Exophiala mesophila]
MTPSKSHSGEPSELESIATQSEHLPSSSSDVDEFPNPTPKRRRIATPNQAHDRSSSSSSSSPPPRKQQTNAAEIPSLSRVKPAPQPTDAFPHVSSAARHVPSSHHTPTTFSSLSISPWLISSLRALSITKPTPIQASCIPAILQGRDCIGGSRTGSGKTVAFAVPILQQWSVDPFGIYALVLTPTRELALQIYEQFTALGTPQNLKTVLVTGGSDMKAQAVALSRRPHVVVATPGRLADHVLHSGTETIAGLSRSRVVVLDEADRLLASGPGSMLPDLNTCLSALPPPSNRLTLLFTATITPEVRALKDIPRGKDRLPVFVSEIVDADAHPGASKSEGIGGVGNPLATPSLLPPTLRQTYLQVPMTHKDAFLHVLLTVPSLSSPLKGSNVPPSIIIFTNRTDTADILHRTLLHLSHPVTSLHSSLPQSQRSSNLASFRSSKSRILIATDVASRGLDIPTVSFVINYDLPRNPVDYVHRVGRTARAGREGTAISFVGQRDVQLVLAIEEYLSRGGEDSTRHTEEGGQGQEKENARMEEWSEEGVNVETRVIRGRTLKDVAEARMEALREVEQGRDVSGWRGRRRKQKADRA